MVQRLSHANAGRDSRQVRRRTLGVLLVYLLFSSMYVAAHDSEEASSESDHMTHYELELRPGGSRIFKVTWGGQPLKARWLFLLSAQMRGDGQVVVKMQGSGSEHPFATYDWAVDGKVHTELTEIPEDGFYNLTFLNSEMSNDTVDIRFQFDQSCECVGKILDLDGGVVVFQQKVEKGEKVHFAFAEPDGAYFRVWAGVRNRKPLKWKTGFDIVADALKWGGRLQMDYTVETGGTHYFFIESVSGTGFIVPEYELREIIKLDGDEGFGDAPFWFVGIGVSVVLLGFILLVFVKRSR